MKLELNFYKPGGKWYTQETIENLDIGLVVFYVNENNLYPEMDYTVHIVQPDGLSVPYRIFKR